MGLVERTATVGAPILYGIRPEHLRLDQQGMPANAFVLVEPTRRPKSSCASASVRSTAAFRERTTRPGETLHVAPDLAHIHLFDQTTGLRSDARDRKINARGGTPMANIITRRDALRLTVGGTAAPAFAGEAGAQILRAVAAPNLPSRRTPSFAS